MKDTIEKITCEYMSEPLAVTNEHPRFSWAIHSNKKDVFQDAYQVKVWKDSELVWDSNKNKSNKTVDISYQGKKLEATQQYRYQIFVWLNDGTEIESDPNYFETGLLNLDNWKARFIEPTPLPQLKEDPLKKAQKIVDEKNAAMMRGEKVEPIYDEGAFMRKFPLYPYDPAAEFRKVFDVDKTKVSKARLYVTAHGIYDIKLNGKSVTNSLLNPGFTNYDYRLRYQTYKIDDLLNDGKNAFHAIVADGWYKGKIAIGRGCEYGQVPGLLLQLELTLKNGDKKIITTDGSWKFSYDGPVRSADLYGGEHVDGRKFNSDVDLPNYDDSSWKSVIVKDKPDSRLDAQDDPLVKIFKRIPAKKVWTAPNGDTLVDFGQNMAGIISVTLHNQKAGEKIRFAHFEQLDKDGNYYYPWADTNIAQTDQYICAGKEIEIFEPHFTYHGFRYVKVIGGSNWTKDQFVACAISTDNQVTSSLKTSDEKLNKLQNNIMWSQRSNNIGIPTDCPTREKAGWTGDVLVYGATALFNQNMVSFYEDWLKSIRLDQKDNGQILGTVPRIKSYVQQGDAGSLGWGDVIFTLPLQLYNLYGDTQVLAKNFNAMKKWMEAMRTEAYEMPNEYNTIVSGFKPKANMTERDKDNLHYLINTGFHFGDWIIPSVVNDQGFTDGPKSAFLTMNYADTTLLAEDARMFSKICHLLGKEDLAKEYAQYNKRVKEAFNEELVTKDNLLGQEMQGNYILALKFHMVSGETEKKFAKRLNELVVNNGYKLDTGFMSTPYLLGTLLDYGYKDTAWKVLWQDQCPSWLYEVEHGATTMWENWDAVRPDGQLNNCSFNHYAFGCVGNFIYRHLLGIQNGKNAYSHVILAPDFSSPLQKVSGSYDGVRGKISVSWEKKGNKVELTYQLPANVTGEIRLPNGETKDLHNGEQEKINIKLN